MTDCHIMLLAYLLWNVGMGLLEWSDGLGKDLGCEVGVPPLDFGQLYAGQWG